MSFEGSIEFIAEDKTYWACDVYDEPANPVSPETGSPALWWHLIDETNGIVAHDDSTLPAAKTKVGEMDVWREDHYGNRFAVRLDLFEPASGTWHRVTPK